jgi:hypothetical protein
MDAGIRLAQAVQNNARWCDALGRARGAPGELHAAYWVNRGELPPYTSRLITLAGSAGADAVLAEIRALAAAAPDDRFSVKDAYACLDLAPLGFHVLFDATWIYRDPATPQPEDPDDVLAWTVVQDRDELAAWERAWRGNPANDAVDDDAPRVFPPALLDEPGVHLVAGGTPGRSWRAAR